MREEKFSKQINKIIANNRSGSVRILNSTMNAVIDYVHENQDLRIGFLIEKLNELFSEQSNFVVLFHFINQFFLEISREKEKKEFDKVSGFHVESFIRGYQNYWKNSEKAMAESIMKDIDVQRKTILMHSNSSTIHAVFKYFAKKGIQARIFQTQSAPANEGEDQATFLMKTGHDVTFITEAAVNRNIGEIDMAILGSDGIYNKNFVNKTGSMILALLFQFYQKPVYVVSDSRKVIDDEKIPASIREKFWSEPNRTADEIWKNAPKNVNIRNHYFEKIPNSLVSSLFTERGKFLPKDLNTLLSDFQMSDLFSFEESIGD